MTAASSSRGAAKRHVQGDPASGWRLELASSLTQGSNAVQPPPWPRAALQTRRMRRCGRPHLDLPWGGARSGFALRFPPSPYGGAAPTRPVETRPPSSAAWDQNLFNPTLKGCISSGPGRWGPQGRCNPAPPSFPPLARPHLCTQVSCAQSVTSS